MKPENGGSSEFERITYRAAAGEKVVIKGTERITCWENIEGTVRKAELPDSMFGDYNPYKKTLGGDWFVAPEGVNPPWTNHAEPLLHSEDSVY